MVKKNPRYRGGYFGKALIKLMEARGVSLTDLEKETGIRGVYISRLRNDHVIPRGKMRELIAKALEVSEAQMLIVEAIEREPERYKNEYARDFLGHELYDRLYRS